jgi:GTP cyclohydrolase I
MHMMYDVRTFQTDVLVLSEYLQMFQQERKWKWVYGVPRGGLLPAYALAEKLGLPLRTSFETKNVEEWGKDITDGLVVDDLIDSGRTRTRFSGCDFAVLLRKKNAPPVDMVRPHRDGPDTGVYICRDVPTDQWVDFFWEQGSDVGVKDNISRIIQFIGDDPNRLGLKETPDRVERSYKEIFSGYGFKPEDVFKTFERGNYNEMVLERDIAFESVCEHHMLPFRGMAHVAYIPGNDGESKILGASKLARLVDGFSRRLTLQEDICEQVTAALTKYLKPMGAACVLVGQHLCMSCRGVQKRESSYVTSSLKGVFFEDPRVRAELMALISLNRL